MHRPGASAVRLLVAVGLAPVFPAPSATTVVLPRSAPRTLVRRCSLATRPASASATPPAGGPPPTTTATSLVSNSWRKRDVRGAARLLNPLASTPSGSSPPTHASRQWRAPVSPWLASPPLLGALAAPCAIRCKGRLCSGTPAPTIARSPLQGPPIPSPRSRTPARTALRYADRSRPIGASLASKRTEVFREVIAVYRGSSTDLAAAFGVPEEQRATASFLARHYLFWHRGEPLALILEVFSPRLEAWMGPATAPVDS